MLPENSKPIKYAFLQELVDSNQVNSFIAAKEEKESGYFLIADTNIGILKLATTHNTRPKKFATLDGLAGDVRRLGFDTFSIIGLEH